MYCKGIEDLTNALTAFQKEVSIKGFLLFGADKNRPTTESLEAALQRNDKPLLGGFFPEIIADGDRREEGFVLVPLYNELSVICFDSNSLETVEDQLTSWVNQSENEIKSVFCFVNALWHKKTDFMQALYNELGPFVNYLGGGAGSLSFQSFKCIFCNQKVHEHAAVLGAIQTAMTIGVAHGWQSISEPIKVTETKGNTVVSLNWKPAFEVYSALVQEHSKQRICDDNFFDVAKSYTLGLVKLDEEMIIRDPYAAENGVMHIVDEVPQGEYIRIMHGDMPSLLEGARQAVKSLSDQYTIDESTYLCIDCISRVLFMQDEFSSELDILNANQITNGVLSIGEIANSGNSSLALFNKTVVVSQWKKEK